MGARLALLLVLASAPAGAGEPGARVLEDHGRWEKGYGAEFYNVVGRLRNTSGHPLAYVKLRVEVLDAAGRAVAATETYNESAEPLAVTDLPPEVTAALRAKVKPIPADGEERFRASFLKEETPAFTTYRVRVMETPAAKP